MPNAAYASGTKVPVAKSRVEIDTLLAKHGAMQRAVLCDDEARRAVVAFVLSGRKYQIAIPLPDANKEQATRERWRAVVLMLKAKLEICRLGVSSVEREFLADLVLPDGSTAHETIDVYMGKLIAEGYTTQLALPSPPPRVKD